MTMDDSCNKKVDASDDAKKVGVNDKNDESDNDGMEVDDSNVEDNKVEEMNDASDSVEKGKKSEENKNETDATEEKDNNDSKDGSVVNSTSQTSVGVSIGTRSSNSSSNNNNNNNNTSSSSSSGKKRSRSPGLPSSSSHRSSHQTESLASKASLNMAAQLVLGMNLQGLGLLLTTNWNSTSNSSSSTSANNNSSSNNNSNNNNNSGQTNTTNTASGSNNSNNNNSSSTSKETTTSSSTTTGGLPSLDQVRQAGTKAILENPPWVHWNKADSAPQLKIEDKRRLMLKGGMRGYRMARASHGVVLTDHDTANTNNANNDTNNANNNNATANNNNGSNSNSNSAKNALTNNKTNNDNTNDKAKNKNSKNATNNNGNNNNNNNAIGNNNTNNSIFYYYEVWVHPPPSVEEIAASVPSNARMGKKLQYQIQQALKEKENEKQEEENKRKKIKTETNDTTNTSAKHKTQVGGHLRLGWSMRTGDLQAPVGYDQWSYAIRDIGGSKIHQSRRQDHWGGIGFGSGDVIGCAIGTIGTAGGAVAGAGGAANSGIKMMSASANDEKTSATNHVPTKGTSTDKSDNYNKDNNGPNVDSSSSSSPNNTNAVAGPNNTTANASSNNIHNNGNQNQIRFFKNGQAMGQFIISKGKPQGGAAFDNIQSGTYYPAISSYMGGSCQVNFGPYFVHAPKHLPSGIKIVPVSDLCRGPLSPEEALMKIRGTGTTNTNNNASQNSNSANSIPSATATSTISNKETRQLFRNKPEMLQAFRDAVQCEANVQYEAYCNHLIQHIKEVIQLRQERKIKVTEDLQQELKRLEDLIGGSDVNSQ